jgi:hypothetical protein
VVTAPNVKRYKLLATIETLPVLVTIETVAPQRDD